MTSGQPCRDHGNLGGLSKTTPKSEIPAVLSQSGFGAVCNWHSLDRSHEFRQKKVKIYGYHFSETFPVGYPV